MFSLPAPKGSGAGATARAGGRADRALRVCLRSLCLIAALLAGTMANRPDPARAAGAVFAVSGGGDDNSWDSALTLREAILVANGGTGPNGLNRNVSDAEKARLTGCTFTQDLSALPFSAWLIVGGCGNGGDTIRFDQSVTQVSLTDALPNLTAPGTRIQGRTPDGSTFLWPRIDGAGMSSTYCSDGFSIAADNVELSVLTIVNLRPASLQVNYACADVLVLSGSGAVVENNLLGETVASTSCNSDAVTRNASYGIRLLANSAGGPSTPIARISMNTIGCHSRSGIHLENGADFVSILPIPNSLPVLPNLIGTDDTGTRARPNGVGISTGTGGVSAYTDGLVIATNLISGNLGDGLQLRAVTNAAINTNVIGVTNPDVYGDRHPLGNGGSGLVFEDSAFVSLDGNVLVNSNTTSIIAANHVDGIAITNTVGVQIGSLASTALVIGSPLMTTSQPPAPALTCRPGWGNGGYGIVLDSASTGATIYPQTVSCNGKAGVATRGSGGGTTIAPMLMALNGGLPIDIGDDGPTALNVPAVTAFNVIANPPTLSGTGCANCRTATYIAIGDPGAPGGGGLRLGIVTNTPANWTQLLPGITAPPYDAWAPRLSVRSFTALAIDAGNNSYELSPRPLVFLPALQK